MEVQSLIGKKSNANQNQMSQYLAFEQDQVSERSSIIPTGAQSPNFLKQSSQKTMPSMDQNPNTEKTQFRKNQDSANKREEKQGLNCSTSESSESEEYVIPQISRRLKSTLTPNKEIEPADKSGSESDTEHKFVVSHGNIRGDSNGILQGDMFLPKHAKLKLQQEKSKAAQLSQGISNQIQYSQSNRRSKEQKGLKNENGGMYEKGLQGENDKNSASPKEQFKQAQPNLVSQLPTELQTDHAKETYDLLRSLNSRMLEELRTQSKKH